MGIKYLSVINTKKLQIKKDSDIPVFDGQYTYL